MLHFNTEREAWRYIEKHSLHTKPVSHLYFFPEEKDDEDTVAHCFYTVEHLSEVTKHKIQTLTLLLEELEKVFP